MFPEGMIVEVTEKKAKQLIKAGAAEAFTYSPSPIDITVNVTADNVEVSAIEPQLETPEKKPTRRRRRKKTEV